MYGGGEKKKKLKAKSNKMSKMAAKDDNEMVAMPKSNNMAKMKSKGAKLDRDKIAFKNKDIDKMLKLK